MSKSKNDYASDSISASDQRAQDSAAAADARAHENLMTGPAPTPVVAQKSLVGQRVLYRYASDDGCGPGVVGEQRPGIIVRDHADQVVEGVADGQPVTSVVVGQKVRLASGGNEMTVVSGGDTAGPPSAICTDGDAKKQIPLAELVTAGAVETKITRVFTVNVATAGASDFPHGTAPYLVKAIHEGTGNGEATFVS